MISTSSAFIIAPKDSPFGIVFGKNSDRPRGEVQELIYEPGKEVEADTKCTYISVPGVKKTNAVILSKPIWMWGCEIGANELGVVGGNVPALSRVPGTKDPGLLGTDLLRLALERSNSAESAVDTIGSLLSEFPQGGACCEDRDDSYYSSFLLADKACAWLMETAGQVWVAKKMTVGVLALTNQLTIDTDYDKHSENLETFAKDNGFWDGEGKLSWSNAFRDPNASDDKKTGEELLNNLFALKQCIGVKDMTEILRDTCKLSTDEFPTAGSQISVLPKSGPCCHWFTATPNPLLSVYKPFVFTPNVRVSPLTRTVAEVSIML